MKYLKKFETLTYKVYVKDYSTDYLIGKHGKYDWESLLITNLLNFIGVDVDYDDKNIDDDWICKYDIDVINFLKEIFLGKEVTFYSKNDKWFDKEKICDVKLFAYKDEVYINVKLETDDWKIICNNHITSVYDYDASNKPEHLKLARLKKIEKYNI